MKAVRQWSAWVMLALAVAFSASVMACADVCHNEDAGHESAPAGDCNCLCCNSTVVHARADIPRADAGSHLKMRNPHSVALLLPADIFRPPTC